MRTKINTSKWTSTLIACLSLVVSLLLTLESCKKDEVAKVATLSTTSATAITFTSATSGGNVTSDGGASVTARGVCWGTSANPTIAGNKTTDGSGTGTFTSSLTGLTAGTTYHIRAYATNSAGTAYGSDVTFTTTALGLAQVTTTAASAITLTTATSGGNVTADGGASVTARGVCWGTTANPGITGSKTTDGNGTGAFTSSLTGLTAGTTYHVRAYATNSVGTAYGADIQFTTTAASLATLTTTAVTSITSVAATSGGNISNDGGAAITARGVCWGTVANPDITGSKTTDGSGTGTFTSSLTGLTAGTTYHVRAYATTSAGTAYGSDVTFTTLSVPTVTTSALTALTATTATLGGSISSDGGSAITDSGLCYGTASSPTITNSKVSTSPVTTTGSFSLSLPQLTAGTVYYVRAFATNAAGTAYGAEKVFTAGNLLYDRATDYAFETTSATPSDFVTAWAASGTPAFTISTNDGALGTSKSLKIVLVAGENQINTWTVWDTNAGSKYTLSFYVKSAAYTGSFNLWLQDDKNTQLYWKAATDDGHVNVNNTWQKVSIPFDGQDGFKLQIKFLDAAAGTEVLFDEFTLIQN